VWGDVAGPCADHQCAAAPAPNTTTPAATDSADPASHAAAARASANHHARLPSSDHAAANTVDVATPAAATPEATPAVSSQDNARGTGAPNRGYVRGVHVYRWDLDRTYLETEIHSVRGLVRAALEEAEEKRTVPGGAALIRGLQAHDPHSQLFVLSGSPTQMRAVLARKLALDGVRVDRLILKDNLDNLRRGRLRAVRGQIGYKLPALLEERRAADPATTESLFGDDAEVDGLIYATYAALLAGEIGTDVLVSVLRAGEAYDDMVERSVEAARALPRGDRVEDIFIRLDRGIPTATFRLLGSKVTPVFSWFQAALCLVARGRLSPRALAEVAQSSALAPSAAANLCQDLVRRGALSRAAALDAVAEIPELRAPVERSLGWIASPDQPPAVRVARDFVAFLSAVRTS
jgi:hypothetical protein